MEKKSWNETYNAYLRRKHSKFVTDTQLIADMVQRATDSNISSSKKLVLGEMNEVYDITTSKNEELIVRISRSKRQSFEVERGNIEKVRSLGVPAPKILLVERVKEDLTFCVEEKIQGKPFRDIAKSLTKKERKTIVLEAGNILSKIHSIKAPGFGTLSSSHLYKSWTELIKEVKRNPKNSAQYKDEQVNSKSVDKAIKIIFENLSALDVKTPQLLHSDYGTKHWLVKDKHIVGILDFEGAKGGDPLYDFAWLDFFQSDSVDVHQLLEGYDNKDQISNNFDFKIKLYDLVLSLRLLEYYISEENSGGINHCVKQLEKGLKIFS